MTVQKPTKGKLLVAEPSIIGDLDFNRSVVLLAEHTETGSVGFILNKPLDQTLKDLIPEVPEDIPVYRGGPVDQDILYFIHRIPDLIPDSVEISSGIYWGGNFDVVLALLQENRISAQEIRFFLGYSGWNSLQLDDELSAHSWIVQDNNYNSDIINKALANFWRENMIALGGDYLLWSNSPENPVYN